jgi:hypothetical protein
MNGHRTACKKIKRKKVHVNKAPPSTPTQDAPISHPSLGGIGAAASGLPFLDQRSVFGGTSGFLTQQHQQLRLQQQQVLQFQQQQLLTGLELPSAAGPGAAALMLGGSPFSRERFLRGAASASAAAENLMTQSYIQDLTPQTNTASGLHPGNFRNFNAGSNNPRNI